jgi:hypothetical protein
MPAPQATPEAPAADGQTVSTTRAARGRSAAPAGGPAKLVIKPIETELLAIDIVGTSPLIVSRFSEKAKTQMLAAQQGVRRQPEKRDPRREFLASLYRAGVNGETGEVRFGIPAMAFKMATIGAGRYYGKQVKMTELRQFMFFYGVSVPTEPSRMVVLDGRPMMREDYVRLAGVNHPADLRYRGCFPRWSATLYVSYTKNLIDRDSLVSLIEAGGMGVGVGEWRPERNGEFGTFRIADHDDAIGIMDELPAEYAPDLSAYAFDENDGEILTLDDFALLDTPPEELPKAKAKDKAAIEGSVEGEGLAEDAGSGDQG